MLSPIILKRMTKKVIFVYFR